MSNNRKRFHLSYRSRLFISMGAMVWLIIAVLLYNQYDNEKRARKRAIRMELSSVERRIIYNYEKGYDIHAFVTFLGDLYQNSLYDGIRISVYDAADSLIVGVGKPVAPDKSGIVQADIFYDGNEEPDVVEMERDRSKMFYYTNSTSADGNLQVCLMMPYNFSLSEAVTVDNRLWWIAGLMTVLATAAVWLSTRLLTRNLTLLRDFARRAGNSESIDDIKSFPNDELGEISRQIAAVYQQRRDAVKKSEEDHQIALHAIEEQARIKRQLTNNINHELKTPVGIISGYLETIMSTPDLDEETRNHFLQRSRENVDRLIQLLNDVSTMTRLEEGADRIVIEELNFHQLVYAIKDDIEETHLAGTMKFNIDIPHDCQVLGNGPLLSGMILNLVKNAATHSKGTEISLRLVSQNRKFFIFSFADDGQGVPPEHIPHLFERFYRVDSGRSRKVGGTGLGLPIVKNTIVSLGGAISVHNRSTGGLEFIFSIPKAHPET